MASKNFLSTELENWKNVPCMQDVNVDSDSDSSDDGYDSDYLADLVNAIDRKDYEYVDILIRIKCKKC